MTKIVYVNRNDLIDFGEEFAFSICESQKCVLRATAAWHALSDPETTYELEDSESTYELRDVVFNDVGYSAALVGLHPNGDIPRYKTYMRLHDALGVDWPKIALRHYLEGIHEMRRSAAKEFAKSQWREAVARYDRFKTNAAERRKAEAAAAAAAKADAARLKRSAA